MPKVNFNVRIPFSSAAATVPNVIEVAAAAEQEGYHGLVTGDHINCELDRHLNHRMGRGVIGEIGNTEDPNFFESLTTYAFLAGKFPSLRLNIGVLLLPVREPLLLAKQIANVDAFSRGRIGLGIGIGNATDKVEFGVMRNNYEFDKRWDLAKEYVDAFVKIWNEPISSYHGEYVSFDNATIYPKPFQKPHPPIWVGGHSDAALKLAVSSCDGVWAAPMDPVEVAAERNKMSRYAKEAGKGTTNLDFALMTRVSISNSREEALQNLGLVTAGHKARSHWGVARALYENDQQAIQQTNQRAAAGTPSEVLAKIGVLVESGVNHFDLYFIYPEVGAMLRQIKLFAKEVLPSFN